MTDIVVSIGIPNMKTIAITIDEPTLKALDDMAAEGSSRSHLVRLAVRAWLEQVRQLRDDARESEILERNADLLKRQASAVISDQHEP